MIKKVLCATILNAIWMIFWYGNPNDPGQDEQIENFHPLITNPKLFGILWQFLERIIMKLPELPPCSTKLSLQIILNVGTVDNVRKLQSIISNPDNHSQSDLQTLESFLNQLIISTKRNWIKEKTSIQNVVFQNLETQTKFMIAISIVFLVFELVLLRKSGFKNKKLIFAILASISSIIMMVCNPLQDAQFMLINFSREIGLSFCLIITILAIIVPIYNLKFRDKSSTTAEISSDEDITVVKENSIDPLYSSNNDLHSEVPANNDFENAKENLDQIDFVFEPPFMFQIPPINETPMFQERKRNVSEQSSSSSISLLSNFSQYSTLSKNMFFSPLSRRLPTLLNENSYFLSCSTPLSTSKISEISSDKDELD